jgi:hypothetical protein
VAALTKAHAKSAYIDGELCALRPDGTTSFAELQAATEKGCGLERSRLQTGSSRPLNYWIGGATVTVPVFGVRDVEVLLALLPEGISSLQIPAGPGSQLKLPLP